MKLLSLDLSSSSTGFAVFENNKLKTYGLIKPGKIKGITKLKYPVKQVKILESMSDQIAALIYAEKPDAIVIEEINRGISRIGQKTLDALHFMVLERLEDHQLAVVNYIDSDGKTGWRPRIGLKMTKEHKKLPKQYRRKIPAQEFVNKKYKTNFNVAERKTDADICDAIGLATAFLFY